MATPEHKEWFKALDSALSSMAASLSMSGTQRDELCAGAFRGRVA